MFVLRYIIEYRLYCQIALCHVVVAFIVSRLSSIITQYCHMVIIYCHMVVVAWLLCNRLELLHTRNYAHTIIL